MTLPARPPIRDQYDGSRRASKRDNARRLATALGWFSIGLGLAELAMPDRLARFIGVSDDEDTRRLLRFYGMREIASGIGVLARPGEPGFLWGRVAGDALDLGTLGKAMASDDNDRGRVGMATAAVLGVAALDVIDALWLARSESRASRGVAPSKAVEMRSTITVNAPVHAVYEYWHDFENLPRFMPHLREVRVTGSGRSHWEADAPFGKTLEWDAETIEDRPDELIAWRSLPSSELPNNGRVAFRPAAGDRGTVVSVSMRYDPPGGRLGDAIEHFMHRMRKTQLTNDLRAFKAVMETGEVLRSDASMGEMPHAATPRDREIPLAPQPDAVPGGLPREVRRRQHADTHFDAGLTTEESR